VQGIPAVNCDRFGQRRLAAVSVDRVNIGFAALTMNKDLGLTPYFYGWGDGIFFISYVLFEVPSNWASVLGGE
jgi:hypothetical protein